MRILAHFALFILVASCSSNKEPDVPVSAATYQKDVRALYEAACTSCHTTGGIGPYPLDSYESAKLYGPIALAAVTSGKMPPWMPSADCRSYEDERRLSDTQIETLRTWVQGGMPEGDVADYRAVERPQPTITGTPDLVLSPETAYLPNSERPDDYRCFPLAHGFTQERYLIGTQVKPEHPELVHHVIIYLVMPQFVAQLDALDLSEEGEGYTCFGGPGAGSAQNIAGWVPGSVPSKIEGDAAIRVPAGARLVMQMHYNTLSAAPVPEKTQLEMWFRETQPSFLVNTRAFPHLAMSVPAGEPNVHVSRTFKNNSTQPWIAAASVGHMHMLGTRISLTAVRSTSEECILDIPKWDFNWQQAYRFANGETVTIAPGESVRLDCWYDNSAANQAIVNGVQIAPRVVTWGEGTLDEMCLGYLSFVEPYTALPEPGSTCTTFQTCYDSCIGGLTPMAGCALQCANQSGDGCTGCVIPGMIQCVLDDCPAIVGATLECLESCQGQPDTPACVRSYCGPSLLAFDGCVAPKMMDGTCDAFVSSCGTDL
jgi:mono/diheme cytochrome c family protein